MKLSENQKLLLKKMRVRQMRYSAKWGWFDFDNSASNVPTLTARALLNKGIFTIDNDGLCHLTELGKTIDIQ